MTWTSWSGAASPSARGDRLHDVRRVPSDAGEEPGRHRVEEEESDEVQPWLVGDDAAAMDRLDRLVFIAEDRQVDPGEVGPEPRAPDDVRRFEDAAVLEQRQPALRADHARNPLDARGHDVLGLDADERRAVGEELWAHPAADRRAHREHAVADEPEQQRQEDELRGRALDAEGDVTALLSREPGRVLLDDFDGDLAARVSGSDDEHRPFLELRGVPVLAGVELDDAWVELIGECGHPGDLVASHRYNDVVSLEAPVPRLDHEAGAVSR